MRKINNEHQRIKEETGAFSSQYRIIQHITTLKEIRKSALRREMKIKVNLFKEKCVEEMAFQKLLGFSFLSFLQQFKVQIYDLHKKGNSCSLNKVR